MKQEGSEVQFHTLQRPLVLKIPDKHFVFWPVLSHPHKVNFLLLPKPMKPHRTCMLHFSICVRGPGASYWWACSPNARSSIQGYIIPFSSSHIFVIYVLWLKRALSLSLSLSPSPPYFLPQLHGCQWSKFNSPCFRSKYFIQRVGIIFLVPSCFKMSLSLSSPSCLTTLKKGHVYCLVCVLFLWRGVGTTVFHEPQSWIIETYSSEWLWQQEWTTPWDSTCAIA